MQMIAILPIPDNLFRRSTALAARTLRFTAKTTGFCVRYVFVPVALVQRYPLVASITCVCFVTAKTEKPIRNAIRNRMSTLLLSLAAICWISLVITEFVAAKQPSLDIRFVIGLRDRGLNDSAVAFCRERQADQSLTSEQRTLMTAELIFTLRAQADASPNADRASIWQGAIQLADSYLIDAANTDNAADRDDPRLLLVSLQAALVELDRGQFEYNESLSDTDPATHLGQAKVSLRQSIRRLESLSQSVEELLRKNAVPGSVTDQQTLEPEELLSLDRNVKWHLGSALISQALAYPEDGPDRPLALQRALPALVAIGQLEIDNPLVWSAQLEAARCERIMGNFERASARLDQTELRDPPDEIVRLIPVERLRIALAADRLPDALQIINRSGKVTSDGVVISDTPEFDLACLDTFLIAYDAANPGANDDANNGTSDQLSQQSEAALPTPQSQHWRDLAIRQVVAISRRHGDYWHRLAQTALARSGLGRTASQDDNQGDPIGSPDLHLQVAEQAFRNNRIEEAVAAWDRAARAAIQQGDPTMSFRMAMTAATALSQRQQHEEAMQRFRQLAIDMPEMANSPAVHRLAIYHAGQLASDHSSDRLDQLSELLTEHVTRWSNSPDIDAVRFQSGGVNELRGDMVSAIRDYQSIGPEFQQMDRVVYAAARCYVGLIESMPPDSPERIRSAKEAVDWFGQQIGTARNTASIASARFLLDCLGTEPGSYARAETMLDELLDPGRSDRTQLPESTLLESQRSEAAALRFFAIAAQGQAEQAGQRLAELRGQPVDQLAATLTDLSQLADSSSDNMRRRLAAAQLQLVETINRRAAELSHDDQMNVERIAVRALLHSSETERGLAACRQLIERYPDQMANHPGVLTDYARLLAVKGDRPSLELALTYWRRLESGYREGSQSWLHAKYEVAALHAQLGNTERAKQVVRLLQILYPDLGGSNLKAKFLRLLEKQ